MWLIILEIVIISLFIFNLYRVIKRFRSLSASDTPHPVERLALALSIVYGKGKLLSLIKTDLTLVYYAFIAKHSASENYKQQFAYAKASAFNIIAIPLLILVVIESSVIHVLIHQFIINKFNIAWLKVMPWLIHVLNGYVFVLFIAQRRAMKLLPHQMNDKSIVINYGILGSITIPYEDIESIEKPNNSTFEITEDKQTFYAKNAVDTPQLLIRLKKDIPVSLMYGRIKLVNKVISVADDESRLRQALIKQLTAME